MKRPLETISSLATILASFASILGILQSRTVLTLSGFGLLGFALAAALYARNRETALRKASITIEGHNIDSLNVASLRRRITRSLIVQEAEHWVEIEGADMRVTWRYSGYCAVPRETAMSFSIDGDNVSELDCVAFDLVHDPETIHPIQPLIIGGDGISTKISVPFSAPLSSGDSFALLLRFTLPESIQSGFGYYTSSLSFAQDTVRRCSVKLTFIGTSPQWVRVYECTGGPPALLLKQLQPFPEQSEAFSFLDDARNRPGESVRVYAFQRILL